MRLADFLTIAAVCGALVCTVQPAHAQGRGHGPPPGRGHGAAASHGNSGGSQGSNPVESAAAAGVDRDPGPTGSAEFPLRNFGAWVDDSFILDPGEAWLGLGLAYSRLSFANELDVPVIDTSVGLVPHVQVAASLPVSNLRYPDGFRDRYLGDVYLSAKIGLRGTDKGLGVALAPLLEVLSDGSALDASGEPIGRVHWGLPVNLEYQGTGWRLYGSAGYFSRGATFGSTTLDVSLGTRAGVLGIVSVTHSTTDPVTFDTGENTSRSRADASAGAYARLGSAVSIYGLIGRTVSHHDVYSSDLSVSAGLSFRVSPPRAARSGGT